MKKWLVFVIAALLALSLAGCELNRETDDMDATQITLANKANSGDKALTYTVKDHDDLVLYYTAIYNDSLFTKTEQCMNPDTAVKLTIKGYRMADEITNKDGKVIGYQKNAKPIERSLCLDDTGLVQLDGDTQTNYTIAFCPIKENEIYGKLSERFPEYKKEP